MQEIREYFTDEEKGIRQEITDRVVGMEGPALSKLFAARRKKAISGPAETVQIRETRRIGRNEPCPCGSDIKFKKCCGSRLAEDDTRVKE